MAGTLTISTLSDGTNSTSSTNCIRGSAKAWLQYNGQTQTILGSFNVSSVTYVGTGNFTVNLTTAMANTNYSTVATSGSWVAQALPSTTSTVALQTYRTDTSANLNTTSVSLAVFSL